MSKEIYISSTPHETRLAIVENDELTEIYYERENEYTLAGSIYNGKVTRVLPGMQSSFVDIGLERDAFLYITDFMEEAGETAEFDSSGEGQGQRAARAEGQRGEGRDSRSGGRNRGSESRDAERADSGERNGGYVSERSQEQARATPMSDMAQASEGRTEEFGGRSERNDRGGRGRGRQDRGGNQGDRQPSDRVASGVPTHGERQGSRAAGTSEAHAASSYQTGELDEPLEVPADHVVSPTEVSGETQEVVGEGAPGADGSRRWRGRRGRRRGRGTGQREGGPVVVGEEASPVSVSPEIEEALNEERGFEIDGSAEADTTLIAAALPQEAALPQALTPQAGQRTDRGEQAGRRERGGRDGRGERGGRDRHQSAPRAPRGFAPSRALYGVDSTPEQEERAHVPVDLAASAEPETEPLILPGESLSKYRQGGSEPAKPDASTARFATPVVLPDNAFKVDPNWDGGAMLPGETLSRYRGGASAPSTSEGFRGERSDFRRPEERSGGRSGDRSAERSGGRSEGRRDGRRDGNRSGVGSGRRGEGGVESRGRTSGQVAPGSPMMVPASVPGADLQSAGPVSGYASSNEGAEEIHAHRPDFLHTALPEATAEAPHLASAGHASQAGREKDEPIKLMDAAQPQGSSEAAGEGKAAVEQKPDIEQEYEPEEASASYRVDPAPPSEYRQSGSAVAEAAPEQEMGEHATGTLDSVSAHAEPEFATRQHDTDFGTVADLEGVAGTWVDPVYAEPVEGQPEPMHPMGNSNFLHPEDDFAQHDVTTIGSTGEMLSDAPLSFAAPVDGGIEHTVVAGTRPAHEEEEFESFDEDAEGPGDEPPEQGFAPGAGDLEEDFIEEDELETTSLHAHGVDPDDLEEEPLEGAADLGTMIRDMSLDHMTRSTGSVDDEEDEDFEEDTLEEDPEGAEDEGLEQGGADGSETLLEEDGPEDLSPEAGIPAESVLERSGESRPGYAAANPDAERRARRDNGRRGGRGDRNDRSRGGNREGASFASDRNGSDRNGSDRNGSDRGSSDRYSSDRGGSDRSGLGERARNTGGGGDRDRGRSGGGRGGRQTMQATNLPAISELLKPGQEILCQIAKEPIAKKGARITSHIALPGRFLVFMPTVSHTGVSRKIESDGERRRLKEILLSEKGEAAGGFIVRTAAAGASEEELRSDLRFLLNLWADIKQRSESSKSPALIYHDLNLVERILRDQVTDNFSAIWVDTETEYERVLRFLQRFQPALIRRVKLYTKETPLFEQFGITEEINKALRSKVWLKSGGSIVINQTEALVAIDINTGKFVGKTARLEDTIVKTNLDAIPEIVRQIRLRDLGGIIIIDFIDMDERKNRNRVMAALEEELKSDRAPSKVLPFNDFGLVAITRKRVKQSLERTLSTTCNVCVGTGMVKSPVTVCNDIYVEMRKMHNHLDRGDVMLRVHPEVVKQLKSTGSRWLQEMEEMAGKTILIKSDPSLHPEQFDIH